MKTLPAFPHRVDGRALDLILVRFAGPLTSETPRLVQAALEGDPAELMGVWLEAPDPAEERDGFTVVLAVDWGVNHSTESLLSRLEVALDEVGCWTTEVSRRYWVGSPEEAEQRREERRRLAGRRETAA